MGRAKFSLWGEHLCSDWVRFYNLEKLQMFGLQQKPHDLKRFWVEFEHPEVEDGKFYSICSIGDKISFTEINEFDDSQ